MSAVIDTTASELTPELLDLMEHEKVIEQGLQTFLDVGNALLAIKAGRKYLAAGYSTFEDYCQRRWDMARSRGYQLVAAAGTVAALARDLPEVSTMVDIPLPESERQVRPLAKLPEEQRAEAWVEAVAAADGGQPTAAEVQAAVDARRPPAAPNPAPAHAAPAEDDDMTCLECGADLDESDHLQWCSDAGFQANENWEAAQASHEASQPGTPDATGAGPDVTAGASIPSGAAPATPRPAPQQKAHPATFSGAILERIAELLLEYGEPHGATALDPFAGTGRVHELRQHLVGLRTIGVELEPEWAALHPDTICGDARHLLDHVEFGSVDVIVTSPTYGNRMADTFTDESVRQTYTAGLGRPLSDGNSGAMQWGGEYRAFHARVWEQAAKALRPGGVFVLNCKNHVRAGVVQRVTEWHVQDLVVDRGLDLVAWDIVPTRGLMAGENHEARVGFESVVVLRKPVA